MNVLVLGGAGMAGHVVALYLRDQGYTVDTVSVNHRLDSATQLLDITNNEKFQEFLAKRRYDVIINCVAVLTKQSESQKDVATYLNAYLPHFLEIRYAGSTTRIIQLSTDGVFSGEAKQYIETAHLDGTSFYDRSKALGEIINDKDLTIRMSIIGPDLQESSTGLFNWFWQQKGEITGYRQVRWNGVTTIELAKAIDAAIKQEISGIYHLAPSTTISKFDLLELCGQVFNRQDITVQPVDTPVFERALLNTRTDFRFEAADYTIMLQEMKQWIDSHRTLYTHYFTEEA